MIPYLKTTYPSTGERIRALREYLRLTRNDFCKRHGFPTITLISWENSKAKIKPSSLKKLIQAFAEENILCTEEWLREGTGNLPQFSSPLLEKEIYAIEEGDSLSAKEVDPINLEIALFKKLHPNSLTIRLKDNYMAPNFEEGDFVGGIFVDFKKKPIAYGIPYLVVLKDNTNIMRLVYQGTKNNLFTLSCYNFVNQKVNPILPDVEIKGLYEVIWHRKNK